MLGACRQTCVCVGRSQGKTRALRGQKKEGKGRGPRQEIIHHWWWWLRWGEAGAGGDRTLPGRVRTRYSKLCLQLLSPGYLQTPSSHWIPVSLSLKAFWQGTTWSWAISGATAKSKLIPRVYSLFWEGEEIV